MFPEVRFGTAHSLLNFEFSYGSPSIYDVISSIHIVGIQGSSTWSNKTVEIKYGSLTLFKTTTFSSNSNIILDELYIPITFAINQVLTITTDVTSLEGGIKIAVSSVAGQIDSNLYPVCFLNQNVTSSATTTLNPTAGTSDTYIVKSIFVYNKIGAAGNVYVGRSSDASGKPTWVISPINASGNVLMTDLKINYGYSSGDTDLLKVELNGTNDANVFAFGYYVKGL